MGLLAEFDLGRLIRLFGCRAFVETGTGLGQGVDQALAAGFDAVYSIEIIHKLALDTALRLAGDQRVTILHAKSARGLLEVLAEITPDAPVLFWLDARFPGAAYGLKPYDGERDEALRHPLESELRCAVQYRDLSRDVVLIGDRHLYEDDVYESGAAPAERRPSPGRRTLRFVDELLGGSHRIERTTTKTGFLCAYPKSVPAC